MGTSLTDRPCGYLDKPAMFNGVLQYHTIVIFPDLECRLSGDVGDELTIPDRQSNCI